MNLTTKLYRVAIIAMLVPHLNGRVNAQNCSVVPPQETVFNGDFELGYLENGGTQYSGGQGIGFQSGLNYVGDFTGANCWNSISDGFGIGRNEAGLTMCDDGSGPSIPYAGHSYLFPNTSGFFFSDHTPGLGGDGHALVVDYFTNNPALFQTYPGGGPVAWQQTVNIVAGEEYTFSAWFANFTRNAPGNPRLDFVVIPLNAGVPVMAERAVIGSALPTGNMVWNQFSGTWTPLGLYTQAQISIEVDFTSTNPSSGADFAFDDISFINGCDALVGAGDFIPEFGVDTVSLCNTGGNYTMDFGAGSEVFSEVRWYEVTGGPVDNEIVAASGNLTHNVGLPGGYPIQYRICTKELGKCPRNDYITITDDFGTLSLPDIELCANPSEVVNTGIAFAPPINSITWELNSTVIPAGNNQPSLAVNQPGNYEVIISGDGNCDANETFTVTSLLPIPDQDPFMVCSGQSVNLTVTDPTGTGTIDWYDASTGGTLVQGNSLSYNYNAGPLPNTFYAENAATDDYLTGFTATGNATQFSGNGANRSRVDFTTYTPIILNSVDIKPSTATGVCWSPGGVQNFTIALYQGVGAGATPTGQTYSQNITCGTGFVTMPVDFNVPAGNYQLRITTANPSTDQWWNSPGTAPGVPGIIDISIATTGPNYSGPFFNWDIGVPKGCARVPVNVIEQTVGCCTPPTALSITTADPTDLCEGDPLTVNGSQTLGVPTDQYYYSWYKDGASLIAPTTTATTSTTPIASVVPADAGYYRYRIEDGNNDNPLCFMEDSILVNVTAAVGNAGVITGTTPVCEGATGINYSIAAVSNASNYTWVVPAGMTITGGQGTTSITVSITGTTDGNVTVTPSNSCGNGGVGTLAVTINPLSGNAGAITGTTSICDNQSNEGYSIAAVANATNYTWTITGDGNITGGQGTNNITVDFGTNASYTIEVTPSNSCGNGTPSQIIVNNTGSVAASLSIAQDPDPACQGDDVVVRATVTGGGATPTIEWYVNAVLQSTGSVDTFAMAAPAGGESVQAIMTASSLGCATGIPANSNTININTVVPPDPAVINESDFSTCLSTERLTNVAYVNGTGTWTIKAGDSGSTNNVTGTGVDIENLVAGQSTTVYFTISSGATCPDNLDSVTITRSGTLTTPDAGADITGICEDSPSSITNANSPVGIETGTWSVASGSAMFGNNNDSVTLITGLATGINELVWTIDNGVCNPESDTVRVFVDTLPGAAVTGPDIPTCASSVFMAATAPAQGIGTWSLITEPGGASSTIGNANDPASAINNITVGGTYTFRWTVSSGSCTANTDDIDINKSGTITTANAGIDFDICETSTNQVLNGNAANPGNGETGGWSLVSGPGGSSFNDTTLTGATINGLTVGTYNLRWRIQNGLCPPSDDFVDIVVGAQPTAAIAGIDTSICGTDVQLYANAIATGTGTWSLISGTGSFGNVNDPTTMLTGVTSPGASVIQWKSSAPGACPDDSTTLTVTSTGIVTPDVSLGVDVNPVCFGSPQVYTATATNGGGAATYNWYIDDVLQAGNTNTFSPGFILDNQEVKVTLNSSILCVTSPTDSDSLFASVVNPPSPSLTGGPTAICFDQTASFTASGNGGTFEWKDSATGAVVGTGSTLSTNVSGTYYVEEDNGVCPAVASSSTTLVVTQRPTVSVVTPVSGFAGNPIMLQGATDIGTISWSPSANLNNPTIATPTLVATTAQAGINTYTMTASNGACIDSASIQVTVFIPIRVPNAFTPNADANNDLWEIEGMISYPNATVTVFNRWGSPVYRSVGNYVPWNGLRNGEEMPIGTYYYIIEPDPELAPMSGSVTLVR